MSPLSGAWYSKNNKDLTNGAVLKRIGIDKNDRIRIDNIGLVFYDSNDNWTVDSGDILLGSLVYTSSLAKKSGIFTQDSDNLNSFNFGANVADQSKGLLVIFNENFLNGLPLEPPPPIVPEPVKPDASEAKSRIQATLKNQNDVAQFIKANLNPSETVNSATESVILQPGQEPILNPSQSESSSTDSFQQNQSTKNNIILTGSANIGANGNGSNNVISGNDGNNMIDGGFGDDVSIGGKGDDTYVVDSINDTIIELPGEGIDTIYSSVNFTLPDQVENLVLTGAAIQGTGNALDNSIIGNSSANTLYGLDGNDFIDGQTGDDFMVGGFGDDTFVIDSAGDIVDERLNAGNDRVLIRMLTYVSYYIPKNVETAQLENQFNCKLYGNDLSNKLLGNLSNNIIYGGGGDDFLSSAEGDDYLIGGFGNDYLSGGIGIDSLEGGLGNDYYSVDTSSDKVVELKLEGLDIVEASCDYYLQDNVESLVLIGNLNLNGTGNSQANLIKGNSGDNSIDGGLGVDILTGKEGADKFILSASPTLTNKNADHITDFEHGVDKIQIRASSLGINQNSTFSFATVSSSKQLLSVLSTSTLFVYDDSTGFLHYNQNGSKSGSGKGGIFAILDNKSTFGSNDITML